MSLYGGLALAHGRIGSRPQLICSTCRIVLKQTYGDAGSRILLCPQCGHIAGEWLTERQQRDDLVEWLRGSMMWIVETGDGRQP
jgi:hypothetical protein